jgi:hypothetical protein
MIELKWVALAIVDCLNLDSDWIEYSEDQQLVTFKLSSSAQEHFLQEESKLFDKDANLALWVLQKYDKNRQGKT